MENDKKRVLAYQVAKTIDHKELSEISGGGAGGFKPTVQITGQCASTDMIIDSALEH